MPLKITQLLQSFRLKKERPTLKQIFICAKGGDAMQAVETIEAITEKGLVGDRYHAKTGYWHFVESCQVTLITEDDLLRAERRAKQRGGLSLQDGSHRRNLVVSAIKTKQLKGKTFRMGSAVFQYEKPRPPCGYIDQITQKGMARALGRNSGVCIRVIQSGVICVGDALILLPPTAVASIIPPHS